MGSVKQMNNKSQGICSRFSLSKTFFKHSLKFIAKNRDLIWLPILSFMFVLILLALVATTLIMDVLLARNFSVYLSLLTIIIGYFSLSFIVIFMQAWLIACIYDRMRGKPGTLTDGFRRTMKRSGVILTWSIFNATIGLILNILENSHDLIADIIGWVLGVAWSILTYFVIPFLVIEGTGIRSTFEKSSSLLGRGYRKLFTFFYFYLIFWIPFITVIYLLYHFQPELFTSINIEIFIVLGVVIFTALGLFSSLFNAIVKSVVYIYYVEKKVPPMFSEELLNHAFKEQRQR